VQACLKCLSPTNRAAIILRYWQGCSEGEIAEALNLTVSAVKSRLHYSRRRLADMWAEKPAFRRPEMEPNGSPVF